MTNKTREKIKIPDKLDLLVRALWNATEEKESVLDGSQYKPSHQEWCKFARERIESVVTQSNNRILRKWKKAIEENSYHTTYPDDSDYIYFKGMQEEYLKAKGEC